MSPAEVAVLGQEPVLMRLAGRVREIDQRSLLIWRMFRNIC